MERISDARREFDERIKGLSPSFRVCCRMLANAIEQILSGECTEDEIADVITSLNPETKGYKREEDYVTIDKGMKMLGLGQNRVRFCALMRENGIVNEKFNTVPIGYNRRKILALKHKEEESYQKRLDGISVRRRLKRKEEKE